MKFIKKKRIVLYCPWTDEVIIGGEEFDGSLTDDNILGLYHEEGKTAWLPTHPDGLELWSGIIKNGVRFYCYKVYVDDFYIERPTFWDKVKRLLS